MKRYQGDHTANISFPLGGIGTGSIGLAGNGALVDWEIRNRPNRESINVFSGFAIKAEDDTRVVDSRFLQGDTMRDFMGGLHTGNHSWGYGVGVSRGTLAGGRHFEHVTFEGDFPIARVRYADERFPGQVEMTAFNPFIPSNDRDSSLPAALFEFRITNTTAAPLRYTLALSATNPFASYGLNEYGTQDGVSALTMHSAPEDPDKTHLGDLTLATDAANAGCQRYWFRGGWFDDMTMFFNDLNAYGPLKQRTYETPATDKPDTCTLTAETMVAPGGSHTLRMAICWYVPNCRKYWDGDCNDPERVDWRNDYARRFASSGEVARYCLGHWSRLSGDTQRFTSALTASSLPASVLDAIQGNLATLKSTTCLRLTDGDFWAWEGVTRQAGSCEGTCQHVWNYAYALPFLFPALERGVRENELRYSLDDNGRMSFRMMIPLGAPRWDFRACVDGQMGTVMKLYREWKLSGDTDWLRARWPQIKRMIEFAWSPDNDDGWDRERTGVMTGRQHHTLDVELFGVHSWLTGFYHGALLAGAQMARVLGEEDTAQAYESLYAQGHRWLEANTFNGEYYTQALDYHSVESLKRFGGKASANLASSYWDEETGQIKYQIGSGCEIDQVLADWHAELMGLPPIFDRQHRISALKSIYKYNFTSMRDLNNPCRVFACNGESGVTMCAWPTATEKPAIPIPYSEEVMTGFEYAFAGGLLQCGMEKEALSVVEAVRSRYDGKKRNPFSEIECGASYARAMASYALLLIYSGFRFDMTKGMLGFRPLHPGTYFWAADGAWGAVDCAEGDVCFRVLYGTLALRRFEHNLQSVREALVNGVSVPFAQDPDGIHLDVRLSAGDVLELRK